MVSEENVSDRPTSMLTDASHSLLFFYQNADMPEIKIWQLQDSTD